MTEKISQRAIDLIIEFEVSSRTYYQKALQKPEWPGLASGVTVGIGYDLGYNTKKQIAEDWGDALPPETVNAMQMYAGLTKEKAKAALSQARKEIVVPWEAAIEVFSQKTTPKWIDMVCNALPNTDLINEDCLGVLVSLAYNRGTSFNSAGDRYKEMRAIKSHMKNKNFDFIPDELRSMKRLWPNTKGLLIRREKEAKLFEYGIKQKLLTKIAPESISVFEPNVPTLEQEPKNEFPTLPANVPTTSPTVSGKTKSWWNISDWFRKNA